MKKEIQELTDAVISLVKNQLKISKEIENINVNLGSLNDIKGILQRNTEALKDLVDIVVLNDEIKEELQVDVSDLDNLLPKQ